MNPLEQYQLEMTRRQLLSTGSRFLGATALTSLLGQDQVFSADTIPGTEAQGLPDLPHFAPKAKRVIYLFMAGGPSHIDTFDFKPEMRKIHGKELPESIRQGQRLSTMTSGQKSFPCVAPMFKFNRHGKHGTWVSEILPKVSEIVNDITIIKSLHTEAINHDPAITFINTGVQQPGKASLGSWLSYGLGSPNQDLPAYVVMISRGPGQKQALYSRLWGSGFLPSKHQGVKMRSSSDPVLYLKDPNGIDRSMRRRMLDRLAEINEEQFGQFGDPETRTRIAQYELAFRMQASVPGLMDLSDEPEDTFELYGPDSKKPGTFARNCVLARRMAERGVPLMAYSPIEQGRILKNHELIRIAKAYQATPAQLALAFLLERDGVIAIPKSASVSRVEENRGATDLEITEEDWAALDAAFPPPMRKTALEML